MKKRAGRKERFTDDFLLKAVEGFILYAKEQKILPNKTGLVLYFIDELKENMDPSTISLLASENKRNRKLGKLTEIREDKNGQPVKKYPKFHKAYNNLGVRTENQIHNKSLKGEYNSNIAKFSLNVNHSWEDKKTISVEHSLIDFLDDIIDEADDEADNEE